jgi:hypothetical protein
MHNAIHDILMPTVPFFDAPCQHQKPRLYAWAFNYLLFSQLCSLSFKTLYLPITLHTRTVPAPAFPARSRP